MEFCVAGWAETSCVRRDAVVWRYACSASAGVHYFSMCFCHVNRAPWCLYGGRVLAVSVGYENQCVSEYIIIERCEYYIA